MTNHQWRPNTLGARPVTAVAGPLWTGQQILLPAAQSFCGGCQGPMQFNRTGLLLDPTGSATAVIPHGPIDDLSPTYLWTGAALLAVNTQALESDASGTHVPGEAAVWDAQTKLWARLPDAPAGASHGPVTLWTGKTLLIWGLFFHSDGASSTSPQSTGLQLSP